MTLVYHYWCMFLVWVLAEVQLSNLYPKKQSAFSTAYRKVSSSVTTWFSAMCLHWNRSGTAS